MADPWAEFRTRDPNTVTFDASNVPRVGAEPVDPWAEFRGPANVSGEPDEFDIRARNKTFRDWQAKRGLPERAADTASFIASMPVRMLTQGQYGAGDVVGLVSPQGGAAINRSETDFTRANPDLLWTLGAAGEVAGGLPMVPKGARPPGPNPTAELAALRAARVADDVAAAERLNVRIPGYAYAEGPTASVAKQLSETPIIGAPARRALEAGYRTGAQAAEDVAQRLSPNATAENAGAAVQSGLDRFRNARLEDLPVSTVEGLGLPSTVQAPLRQTMSQGAREVADAARPIRESAGLNSAETSRGVTVPSARARDQLLTTRATAENLTDQQLAHLIRIPAEQTSAATRAEALYERAWRMVPDLTRVDGRANPNLLNAANTRAALARIEGNIANQIAGQGTINGDLAARIGNPRSNFTLSDLRAIRTEVGRALGNQSPAAAATLDRGQLKSLYGALSRDIEIGLETLTNRAAVGLTRPANAANYVNPQVARQAASALHGMRTADRYFRMSIERMDRFSEVLGAASPEAAARRIVHAAQEGIKGNSRLVRSAMGVLRPEERSQFGSLLVHEMGRPVPSARGMVQEAGWSAQSFMTNWNRMAPEMRNMFFNGPHRQAIDDLARMADRIANVEALANTSRSGTNSLNIGGLLAAGAAVATGAVDTLFAGLGSAGAGFTASVLLSRPEYANWLVRYNQWKARTQARADRRPVPPAEIVREMAAFAAANPELNPVYDAVRGRRR